MTDFVTTVIASVSVSAALTALLIWFTKTWIGERLKGAIQNEYALKLELHKALLKVEHDREIEQFKSALADVSAERNARRDYEYEARKNLYTTYEPLLFQLLEQSESAYHRVLSLARSARKREITESGGWLDHRGYYMLSTIYKLLAPIALFKVIQQNLTLVDLSVDNSIAAKYTLAKVLHLTFTDDFGLAEETPELKYRPHDDDADEHRKKNPQKYWRQGIPAGCLDNVLHDCMLTEDKPPRLRTFGDFERVVKKLTKADPNHDFHLFVEIFTNFHPVTRPILWRVLVTQAHIHRLIVDRVGSQSESPYADILASLSIPPAEQSKFQWSANSSTEPFTTAESFLGKNIAKFQITARLSRAIDRN